MLVGCKSLIGIYLIIGTEGTMFMIFENKTIYVDFDNTLCLFKQLPATEEIPAVTEPDALIKDDNALRMWARKYYKDCAFNSVLGHFLLQCKNNGCTLKVLTNETWPFKVQAKKYWMQDCAPGLIDDVIRLSKEKTKADFIHSIEKDNKNVILIDDRYTEQIKPALRLGIEAYTPQYLMLDAYDTK